MSDEDDDPFAELGEDVADREGDPFEHLNDASDDAGDEQSVGENTPQEGDSEQTPFESSRDGPDSREGEVESEPGQDSDTTDDAAASEEPAVDASGSGMDFGIDRGTGRNPEVATDAFADADKREGDPFEGMGSAFEEMDVGSVDPDEVWEGLESAEARGSVGEVSDRVYAEVSKHSFCEQCEYFSDPPDVDCSHEGTEIVEFLDMETVRLVDCPIVAEREDLEAED